VRLKLEADGRALQRLARVLADRHDEAIGRTFVLYRGKGRRARPTNTDDLATQPMQVMRMT
jgi:hypothetical protein